MPDVVIDGERQSAAKGFAREIRCPDDGSLVAGPAGAVWTTDSSKAQRVAASLRPGTIWINDYHPYRPAAERGVFKQSGVGRELGYAGLSEFVERKHIHENLAPAPSGWFGGTEPTAS